MVIDGWRHVPGSGEIEVRCTLRRGVLAPVELAERIGFGALAPRLGDVLAEGSPRRTALERLLDHLALIVSISYYKAAAPGVVELRFGAWTPDDLHAHGTILEGGLGEFAFVNGLDPRLRPRYVLGPGAVSVPRHAPIAGLGLQRRSLVPVGGGKDSCVTIEALRAGGDEPVLVTVNRYPPIQHVIDASGLPDLALTRRIDPLLLELNALGALNGHVPATAMVSMCVLAAAIVGGYDEVVMSNERSASEGNVEYSGMSINHQWSKSAEAEGILAGLVASVSGEVRYGSMLRPLSELAITRIFAESCTRYLDVFTSCNRNFRLDPARRSDRWCGECPKCQFVYLAMATVLPRGVLEGLFGAELLSTSPRAGFEQLLGLADWKPFECVGEMLECRIALTMVARSPEWADHPVVCALMDVVSATGWRASAEAMASALAPVGIERLPRRWRSALAAVGVTRGDERFAAPMGPT
jgi:hypothetical protein